MKYIVLFQHLQLKNIGLVLLCSFMFSNLLYSQSTREVINFDHGWLFNRYGLQPDGKRIDEPFGNGSPDSPSPKELAFNDKDWRKLDVPHAVSYTHLTLDLSGKIWMAIQVSYLGEESAGIVNASTSKI